jgi:very-long-chain enoyl-CoA reductase
LADKTQKLSHYITSAGAVNVVFKDLGMQISWTTVFLVEYFGPILITCLLLAFREQIYGSNPELLYVQKLGVAMALIHYLKREYETLFVHRFSNDTMPWTNIIKNSAHYWAIFGGLAMYFFLRPDYTPPSWVKYEQVYTIFFWKFMFCEYMNYKCHCILRDLRKPGTTERGIPKGNIFHLVSSANYFWESMAWLLFAVMSQVFGAYVFFLFSSGQMLQWALKKHH